MTTTPVPSSIVSTTTTTTAESPSNNDTKDASITSAFGFPPASSPGAAELTRLTLALRTALRQFPDFPAPGVVFEDIMPLFSDVSMHESLIRALEIYCLHAHGAGGRAPDVIVGLDARGFLFGPSLALRLGAGFVPVRKKGKLPGPTVTARYAKEYGEDLFQIQADSIKKGQNVLVVDDIIATGGSAAAAGSLVKQLGGNLLGYVFILELDFLKGREKLDAPAFTLLSSQ
ncbi:MAG: adenine phosphoribosyltransferase [Geoglossum umbratile]|nr:MAG: adenine phosphoribosyltransferase [Geoglossum umbratile]